MAKVTPPEQATQRLRELLRRYGLSGTVHVDGVGIVHARLKTTAAMLTISREKLDAFEVELAAMLKEINAEHRTEVVQSLDEKGFAEMMRRRRNGSYP